MIPRGSTLEEAMFVRCTFVHTYITNSFVYNSECGGDLSEISWRHSWQRMIPAGRNPRFMPGELGNEDSQDCPTEDSRPDEKYQPKERENETTEDDDQEDNESNEVISTKF